MINKLWLADQVWAQSYFAKVKDFQARMPIEAVSRYYAPAFSSEDLVKQMLTIGADEATINIIGVLSPTGPNGIDEYLGEVGTSYEAIQLAFIEAHDRLKAGAPIYVNANGPGGTVDGVEPTSEIIKEVAAERPVIFMGGYMVTSAYYWLAASGTEIRAVGKTSQFGSIGVLISGYDYTKMLDDWGVVVYNLTNDESRKKAATLATKEGRGLLIERLNAFYQVFLGSILDGRGAATTKAKIESLEGRVVLAEQALEIGLIDSISPAFSNNGNGESNNTEPANAGDRTQEQDIMKTLKEAIAACPAIGIEHDHLLAKAKADGKAEAISEAAKELAIREEATSPYISNEKYPQAIRALAAQVMVGKEAVGTLKSTITIYDSMNTKTVVSKAKKETKDDGATPPAEPESSSDQKQANAETAVIQEALGIKAEPVKE